MELYLQYLSDKYTHRETLLTWLRNNRELSQLGAFISITDNTQEIGSGTFDANEVNRHVMSIGATDHTGLTVPPAIGIGTTNPGKDKVTVVS